VFCILCVTHTGIQEQTVEQFFFFIHGRKHVLEFLPSYRASAAFLGVVEFRKDLAGGEDVPCSQARVERFKNVVNGAIIQIGVMRR
jgi:hypothetical protein